MDRRFRRAEEVASPPYRKFQGHRIAVVDQNKRRSPGPNYEPTYARTSPVRDPRDFSSNRAVMDLFEADYSVRIGRLTRRSEDFLRKITP
jgi:hypothetical protein